jgi:branched-chain amino acid transport system ATP-binding protein
MQALRIISEDHTHLWRLATTVDQIADEIAGGGAIDTGLFQAIFDYLEHFVDAFHHPKEDDYLFRLLRLRSVEAHELLDLLTLQHREGPDRLRRLRHQAAQAVQGQSTARIFADDLRGYTAVLKSHIRTEETLLMPMAKAMLTVEDWREIDGAFLNHQDPLFGEAVKAEFRGLFHRIANLAPESIGLGSHSAGHLPAPPAKAAADVLLRVTRMESCYGRIKALKGISLDVQRGETVALVGANGAGKTTFLRTLSGVQAMSAGSIVFEGEDISKMRSDLRMRRGICQSPEGRQVFGPLSIDDNLRLGAYTQPKQNLAEDLDKVFTMFPILKEKRKLPAGTLSGGQQQMLAIARALMGRPKLLLLDEPSMGLAPLLVEEVFNVVKSLKAQGMTILLVEQNAFAALGLADRGYVLETGNVTLTGTGQELISNEQVRAAYLGM